MLPSTLDYVPSTLYPRPKPRLRWRSLSVHETSKYPFRTEAEASSWLSQIWIKRRTQGIEKRENSSKQTSESMIEAATSRHMQITPEANISVTSLGCQSWPKIRGPFDGSLRSWRNSICARSLGGEAAFLACREKRAPKVRENSAGFQSVSSPFSARLLLLYQAKTLRVRTIPPATQAILTDVIPFWIKNVREQCVHILLRFEI